MSRVTITEPAAKALQRVPRQAREEILDRLDEVERASPSRVLQTVPGRKVHQLRVGDRQVIVDWNETDDTVQVLGVRSGSRDDDRLGISSGGAAPADTR